MTDQSQITVEEGNKLIAAFDGHSVDKHGRVLYKKDGHLVIMSASQLQYHSSFDWIMPVVEKVRKTKIKGVQPFNSDQFVRVAIVPGGYVKIENLRDTPIFINVSVEGSLIAATWKAIVQFIQWYNSQKSKQ